MRLEVPHIPHKYTRYDFMIVLPPSASADVIPRLLRESIERDFEVDVTHEDGTPPTLTVRSR